MYIPPHFAENDRERLHAFMRANGFGTLVSVIDNAPFVTLMPFTLIDEGEHGTLIGHIARANPHAATFDGTHDSICLFQGPHAYISPRWYEAPIAVPTWNYTAVEAHGRPERIEDPTRMRSILDTLVHQYESGMPNPWSLTNIPQNVGEKMIEAMEAARALGLPTVPGSEPPYASLPSPVTPPSPTSWKIDRHPPPGWAYHPPHRSQRARAKRSGFK